MSTRMHCTFTEAHDPHEWDSDVVRFGPYACDGSEVDQPVIHVPHWLMEEYTRAMHRRKINDTTSTQAWDEGFQAGTQYGKGGAATANPYE